MNRFFFNLTWSKMPQTSVLFKLMFMMLRVKHNQVMLPIICTVMHITVKEVLQHFCIMDSEQTVYCNIYCSKVKRLTSYAAFHTAVPSAPTPTGQMECFPHLLDLIHISVWKWAHKKCLERREPFKKKEKIAGGDWGSLLPATFRTNQTDLFAVRRCWVH